MASFDVFELYNDSKTTFSNYPLLLTYDVKCAIPVSTPNGTFPVVFTFEVIYQTLETPRRELKIRRTAKYFMTKFEVSG